jgi:hypothetical protein
MREIGHGPQPLWIGLKLLEPVTDTVHHLIERSQGQIGKVVFAQLFPEVFYRIAFWTGGRLCDQANIRLRR